MQLTLMNIFRIPFMMNNREFFLGTNKNMDEIKKLCFVNKSPHDDPSYSCEDDSGFDLRAWIEDGKLTIPPLGRALVHTGLYFILPKNCEIQVRPRSGMSLKLGLTVLNTPGTVDGGYRGEVCVICANISNEPVTIEDGDRVAQGVLCPVFCGSLVNLSKVDSVNAEDTERGSGGFGHTGKK